MSIAAERKAWWSARCGRYNMTLLVAGPISAGLLLMIWWLFERRLPCLEITGVSMIFGGILFLCGLALANACYFFGGLAEQIIRPRDASAFRRRMYRIGIAFSLLLILSPPIVNLFDAFSGLPCVDKFGQTHALLQNTSIQTAPIMRLDR
jgi:hypothetical protein